jgi:hypothetical protein
LARADFVEEVGPENILPNVQAALARARAISSSLLEPSAETPIDLHLIEACCPVPEIR